MASASRSIPPPQASADRPEHLRLAPERRATIKALPTSLKEALDALQADHAFLLEGGVFDEELIADWVKAKMQEFYAVRNRPHPYEVQLYFDL